MQTTHSSHTATANESAQSTGERIGHDLALLDEVKTIFDMVGWFIHPDLKPLTIEEMNAVIAETWSSAR
ncbi:hypothetical protein [Cupriavidus pauculus]|uniref:Uncharacterized protein n=1 Tax=Cupriavidus pauculus TaxID=82633 RepID=A0A2N5CC03_9BURK|nr:hypothetical protein [Cupriavidus pauculus]PLP99701.1 hypothetical protein CYJ10_14985 [Cupriavidus pauculus]